MRTAKTTFDLRAQHGFLPWIRKDEYVTGIIDSAGWAGLGKYPDYAYTVGLRASKLRQQREVNNDWFQS